MKKVTQLGIYFLFIYLGAKAARTHQHFRHQFLGHIAFFLFVTSIRSIKHMGTTHHSKKDLRKTTPMMGADLLLKKDATSSRSKGNWRSLLELSKRKNDEKNKKWTTKCCDSWLCKITKSLLKEIIPFRYL